MAKGTPLCIHSRAARSNEAEWPWLFGGVAINLSKRPSKWIGTRVSRPTDDIVAELRAYDLEVSPHEAFPKALLTAAQTYIELVPTLAAVCEHCIGYVHLLRAPPEYDISHSEPRWPQRIFVSVPERDDEVGAMRLAENIIHEAMHLNLTNFEDRYPLVHNLNSMMASPWRADPRSYQGVLHGLYVFRCLHRFFLLLRPVLIAEVSAHVERRIGSISQEINTLDLPRLCSGLTPDGACLARRWHAL